MDFNSGSGLDVLDEDIMGELLPRLDVTDVRHARLCCKGWRTAIEHQIRRMQPLYLPEAEAPGAAYNSLDSLQLPLIRPVHLGDATTATLQHSITSLAPLHGIAGFSSMWHVSVIDLRGQKLPHRTLQLLSGAIRRLRALTLDCCELPAAGLLHATGLTTLQQLSLAGIRLTGALFSSAAVAKHAKQLAATDPMGALKAVAEQADAAAAAAAARTVNASAAGLIAQAAASWGHDSPARSWVAARDHDEQQQQQQQQRPPAGQISALSTGEVGMLLDAVLLPQLQWLSLDISNQLQVLPHTSAPFARRGHGLPIRGHATKLTELSHLTSLSLADNKFHAADWQALSGAMGPRLNELHILWDGSDQALDDEAFASLSKFSRLQTLNLSLVNMSNQSMWSNFSLGQLSALTALKFVSDWRNMGLLMSIASCSKVARLELSGIREPFTDEYLVQVVRSMPQLESLSVSKLHQPTRHEYILRQPGDSLLSQLDYCCPQLTQLLMPDVPLDGRGLKLASAGLPGSNAFARQVEPPSPPSAAGAGTSWTQSGGGPHCTAAELDAAGLAAAGFGSSPTGLRSLQRLELCVVQMMRSTLPHLSHLTGLRAITLSGMALCEFPHACRLHCFEPLSTLKHLTSLRVLPIQAEQARFPQLPPYVPGQIPNAPGQAHPPLVQQQQQQQQVQQLMQVIQNLPQLLQAQGNVPGLDDGDPDPMFGPAGPLAHAIADFQHDFLEVMQALDAGGANAQGQAAEVALVAAAQAAGAGAADGGAEMLAEWPLQAQDLDAEDDAEDEWQEEGEWGVGQMDEDIQDESDDVEPELEEEEDEQEEQQQQQQVVLQQQAGPAHQHLQQAPNQQQLPQQQQQQQAAHQEVPDQQQQQLQAQVMHQLAVQQQAAAALQPWMRRLAFEPHLHFLSGLPGLVELELGCLMSNGLCLLHLHDLPSLRSLTLGGNITLSEASWQWLSRLQLHSVTQLSLTGCRFVQASGGGSVDVGLSASSWDGAGSSAAAAGLSVGAARAPGDSSSSSMDILAGILASSFHNCVKLELGSCSSMSYSGLEVLLLGMRSLKVLRLLGVKKLQLKEPASAAAAAVDAATAAAAAVAKNGEVLRAAAARSERPADSTAAGSGGNSGSGAGAAENAPQQVGRSRSLLVQKIVQCVGSLTAFGRTQQRFPYLDRVLRRLKEREGPAALLELQYLEVCEGEAPQSGLQAAAGMQVSYMRGQCLAFSRYEGQMVQVQ